MHHRMHTIVCAPHEGIGVGWIQKDRHIERGNREQGLREMSRSQAEHLLMHHLQAVSLSHAVSLMSPGDSWCNSLFC